MVEVVGREKRLEMVIVKKRLTQLEKNGGKVTDKIEKINKRVDAS